jgi:hypothetical protein
LRRRNVRDIIKRKWQALEKEIHKKEQPTVFDASLKAVAMRNVSENRDAVFQPGYLLVRYE